MLSQQAFFTQRKQSFSAQKYAYHIQTAPSGSQNRLLVVSYKYAHRTPTLIFSPL